MTRTAMQRPVPRPTREFIASRIRKYYHEGYPLQQAAAIAYSQARRAGLLPADSRRRQARRNPHVQIVYTGGRSGAPWGLQVRGRLVGCYPTRQQAEAAYQEAMRRMRHNPGVTLAELAATAAKGLALGVGAAVGTFAAKRTLGHRHRSVRANPLLQIVGLPANPPAKAARHSGTYSVPPFRDGQVLSVEKAHQWIREHGPPHLLKQFEKAIQLQTKANRTPKKVVFRLLPIGDPKRVEMLTAQVLYGDVPETMYVPPDGSHKGRNTYLHEWGEGTGRSRPVPMLVDPSGRSVILPLNPGQKITDWARG